MPNQEQEVITVTIVEDTEGEKYHLEALLLEVRYSVQLLGRTVEEALLYHPYFKTPEGKGEHRDKLKQALTALWDLYSDLCSKESGLIETNNPDSKLWSEED